MTTSGQPNPIPPTPAVQSPALTTQLLPRHAPEFAILEWRGTLKIPLTTNRAIGTAPVEVPAAPVQAGRHLPVSPIETAHRALAPTTGTTRSGCEATLFGGQTVSAVEFVCDPPSIPVSHAEDRVAEPVAISDRLESITTLNKDALGVWIEKMRDAGIHADRRGSPDLIAQLIQAIKRPIDTVICSLLDSDPTACVNSAIAAQFAQEVVAGTNLVSRIVGATRTLICADQRMPSSWTSGIRRLVRKSSTRLMTMANDYPQPDPTLLLYTVLNRRLRPGRVPVEQGVVLLDAATAWAIGRLFLADEKMLHTPLAVRDHARKLSHFVLAPIGMQLGGLLCLLGESDLDTLIRGGDLLRDVKLTRHAVVSGSELVIHTSDPEPDINPNACIRCGWCMEACPTRVHPAVVLEAAQRDDVELAEQAGIEACIDCGICSYVCPSKLPLLVGIRMMKKRHDL